jgi:hypothetical protein
LAWQLIKNTWVIVEEQAAGEKGILLVHTFLMALNFAKEYCNWQWKGMGKPSTSSTNAGLVAVKRSDPIAYAL